MLLIDQQCQERANKSGITLKSKALNSYLHTNISKMLIDWLFVMAKTTKTDIFMSIWVLWTINDNQVMINELSLFSKGPTYMKGRKQSTLCRQIA